jgi:hypothetical protein
LPDIAKVLVIEGNVTQPQRGHTHFVRLLSHCCVVCKRTTRRVRISLKWSDKTKRQFVRLKYAGKSPVHCELDWYRGARVGWIILDVLVLGCSTGIESKRTTLVRFASRQMRNAPADKKQNSSP